MKNMHFVFLSICSRECTASPVCVGEAGRAAVCLRARGLSARARLVRGGREWNLAPFEPY